MKNLKFMKSEVKPFHFLAVLLTLAAFVLLGCSNDPYVDNTVNWKGDNGGTLELINGSNRDIVVFIGQVPSKTSVVGGVKAGATTAFDICKHVQDCDVGGYVVLRGMSREEYDNNWPLTLENARIEFNSMATYRRGTTYRIQIDKSYMGDNAFRVTNRGRIGMELRKDSPDGEKVAYLPRLQQNQMVYTQTTSAIYLFPVYVFFNNKTGEVTTLQSTDLFDGVRATPRPINANQSGIQDYYFPNDPTLTWEKIVGTLKSPCAYINITNNVLNQGAYFTVAGSNRLLSQDGYDAVGSGEQLVFEVASTEEGTRKALTVQVYSYDIPVLFEGEDGNPLIENGYDYSVSVNVSGDGRNRTDYSATITRGKKRDLSDQINSL